MTPKTPTHKKQQTNDSLMDIMYNIAYYKLPGQRLNAFECGYPMWCPCAKDNSAMNAISSSLSFYLSIPFGVFVCVLPKNLQFKLAITPNNDLHMMWSLVAHKEYLNWIHLFCSGPRLTKHTIAIAMRFETNINLMVEKFYCCCMTWPLW